MEPKLKCDTCQKDATCNIGIDLLKENFVVTRCSGYQNQYEDCGQEDLGDWKDLIDYEQWRKDLNRGV